MHDPKRRDFLAKTTAFGAVAIAASAADAQTFGNPDTPPQGSINARGNPAMAASDTLRGPANPALANQFSSAGDPPATDVNAVEMFWASFNNAHKRIQNGGWAR